MKIRAGFVSNSSSSSFCIYGLSMDIGEIEDFISNTENKTDEENIRLAKLKLNGDDESDVYEFLEKIEKKFGFSTWTSEDGECYIGRDFTSIGDDETGREFKNSTEEKLKSIFGNDVKVSAIEEVIYS